MCIIKGNLISVSMQFGLCSFRVVFWCVHFVHTMKLEINGIKTVLEVRGAILVVFEHPTFLHIQCFEGKSLLRD